MKRGPQAVVDPLRAVVGDRSQQRQRAVHVAHRVERLLGVFSLPAFLAVPLLLEGRVFRLNLGRIAEHHRHQVGRGRGGHHRAAKTLLHQLGQQPAVVDMGVGQKHHVDVARTDRAGIPVPVEKFTLLEQAAIDQHLGPVGAEVVLRAGHLAGRAEKLKPHGVHPVCPVGTFDPQFATVQTDFILPSLGRDIQLENPHFAAMPIAAMRIRMSSHTCRLTAGLRSRYAG